MKLIAKKPCSFGGKDFFINDEIPVNAVLNPKQQEELGVLSIVSDEKPQQVFWKQASRKQILQFRSSKAMTEILHR